MSGELRFQRVKALRRLLRRREVSAVELARAALADLDTDGRGLNAVAELTPDIALREARAADRVLRAGDGGPLCGIPYGAKDLLDTAGIPTRWGTPHYRDRVATGDATVIKRLRAAGAVLVAKLAMIEMAGGGGYRYADASIDGPCRNPWDRERWSGGSSSGSASAVAAGLIPVALGSETGGSLIIPASYCGISTIRPTAGAVSSAGSMPLSWSMDKIGPLARSAEDCDLVLSVIAGRDPLDPHARQAPLPPTRELPARAAVLRSGLDGAPATAACFDDALRVVRRMGVKTRAIELPVRDYYATYSTILAVETTLAHRDLIANADSATLVDQAQLHGLRRMLDVSLGEYAEAVRTRAALAREIHDIFDDFDVLLSPSVLTEATRLDEDVQAGRARRGGHAMLGAIAGVPGVSVPMGFGPSGMPLGLAMTGPQFSDRQLLGLARRYQQETGWHERRPPMLGS